MLLLLLLTKGIVGQEKLCLLRNRTSDFIAVEDATSTYLRFALLVLCVSGFSFFCFLPTTPSSMPRQTSISIGPKNSSPQFSPCAQTFNYSVSSSMFLTRSPPWMVKEGVQSTQSMPWGLQQQLINYDDRPCLKAVLVVFRFCLKLKKDFH